ncbi:putative nuclease of predicted toxin-antitoxin system [Micromonospora sp. Llam0]|nr:putative nuclease of predicted toxin-antitoxin system [Micromonospora sp. Llam0]
MIDECLSIKVAHLLADSGYDALHVNDCGLAGEPDQRVLSKAVTDGRVLLSADTDFGEIVARSGAGTPSVILFRRSDRSATSLTSVLLANLTEIAADLEKGAFVVLGEERLRIRPLPFR